MSQFARPVGVVSNTGWTDQAGSSVAANLVSAIAEVAPNDATFIQSSADPSNATIEYALSAVTDPESLLNHIRRVRLGKSGTGVIDQTVSLRQGAATVIASWTYGDVSTTPTTIAETLTSGQIDAITDWSDLRLRFVANLNPVLGGSAQHVLPWLNNA